MCIFCLSVSLIIFQSINSRLWSAYCQKIHSEMSIFLFRLLFNALSVRPPISNLATISLTAAGSLSYTRSITGCIQQEINNRRLFEWKIHTDHFFCFREWFNVNRTFCKTVTRIFQQQILSRHYITHWSLSSLKTQNVL